MRETAIRKIIKRYKDHLREHGLADELYKWELLGQYRGRPDVEAVDLEAELRDINFANLIYPLASGTAVHMARDRTERYRNCLKILFDDSLKLSQRIINFTGETLDIYQEIMPNKSLPSHHDERTAATFLTYYNPDKYTFYQSTLYRKFCKDIGVSAKKKNEKYVHYLELVDDLIENYIKKDEELITLFRAALPDGVFEDQNYKILAQDILYLTMDKGIGKDQIEADAQPIIPKEKHHMTNTPLNQILFGPPGTGKTYHTINKSLEIINPAFDFGQPREVIKAEFERLVDAGQIVFTTFHQSMSYEDFVEGIKPVEPEKDGDPVIYRIDYGVFRKLCVEAAFDIARSRESKTTEEVLDFSILYDNFVEAIEERLSQEEELTLTTKTGGKVVVESISQQGNFIIKHQKGTRNYTVSKSRLTKLNSAIENLDDVNNINDQFREVIGGSNSSAYWSVLNAIRKEKPVRVGNKEKRTFTFEEKKAVVLSLSNSDYKNQQGKPYVLIIDEINRGNVSQIFGELITLIEKDKRQGKAEALEVVLPYSKEKFGVPPNLFIIGTMNTADRSVEALDTALRRRFSFVEMPPVPSVIRTHGKLKEKAGILEIDGYTLDLEHLLTIINGRIEILLDRDHLLGHSYFMAVDSRKSLQEALAKHVLPLMQEYFYGDYGKISLVLGEDFCRGKMAENKKFARANHYDTSAFDDKIIYTIPNILSEDFPIVSAIKTLFNQN